MPVDVTGVLHFLVLWEENLCFVAETTELFLEMYYNDGIISRQGRLLWGHMEELKRRVDYD